ncbi:hypothetical protein EYF80_022763 [Liparis tanakae]|uniref:Uncharacterized protein n=1 Tax=Liparis tanakae TaxID=230148 RepID=A0A4Z2HN27_9TELE|nr:hypothetical protein EYF80_022763 [Liparis tanakae]
MARYGLSRPVGNAAALPRISFLTTQQAIMDSRVIPSGFAAAPVETGHALSRNPPLLRSLRFDISSEEVGLSFWTDGRAGTGGRADGTWGRGSLARGLAVKLSPQPRTTATSPGVLSANHGRRARGRRGRGVDKSRDGGGLSEKLLL